MPYIVLQLDVLDAQFCRLESSFLHFEQFVDPLLRFVHFAGGAVNGNRPGFAAQDFVNGFADALSNDVPAGRFYPEISPPQEPCLGQKILHAFDIGGVSAQQVASNEVAQPLSLDTESGPCGISLYAVVCRDLYQRKTVVGLRITRNPCRPESMFQRDRSLEQFYCSYLHGSSIWVAYCEFSRSVSNPDRSSKNNCRIFRPIQSVLRGVISISLRGEFAQPVEFIMESIISKRIVDELRGNPPELGS